MLLLKSLSLFCLIVLAKTALKPSGVLKSFEGPEGEIITMIEVNEGKEMVVNFKKLGGDLEGQSRIYKIGESGRNDINVFWEVKKGSKTQMRYLLEKQNDVWTFHNPANSRSFRIYFSEKETKNQNLDQVLSVVKQP